MGLAGSGGGPFRQYRSLIGDVVLAVVLAGFGIYDAMNFPGMPGPRAVNAIVVTTSALFLIWRRRRPLLAFTGSLGSLTVLALVFGHYESGSSVFIGAVAVYSATAYGKNVPYVVAAIAGFSAALNLGQPRAEAIIDLLWTAGAFTLMFSAGLAARQYRSRTTALEAQNEELERSQGERAAIAAAEERQRIARELHDIIAHGLSAVVLQAGAAELHLDRNPARVREALRSIRLTSQEAIGELGTLVTLARDDHEQPRHPLPTLADLDHLLATTRNAGLAVAVAIEGEPSELPAALQLSAYRTIQEGLTNALKHAGTAEAHVVLRYRDDEFEVEVVDNGDGRSQGPGSRLGLAGLKERTGVFGGRLEAGPRPDGGWLLRAVFPLVR
jgi:signal transduction histidine kinase